MLSIVGLRGREKNPFSMICILSVDKIADWEQPHRQEGGNLNADWLFPFLLTMGFAFTYFWQHTLVCSMTLARVYFCCKLCGHLCSLTLECFFWFRRSLCWMWYPVLVLKKTRLGQKSGVRLATILTKFADTPVFNRALFWILGVEFRLVIVPLFELLCVRRHSLLFRKERTRASRIPSTS